MRQSRTAILVLATATLLLASTLLIASPTAVKSIRNSSPAERISVGSQPSDYGGDPIPKGGGFATIPLGDVSGGLAMDASNGDLYVAEPDYVSVISATTDRVVAIVPVGNQPDTPAVDGVNGKVFVANYGSGNLTVLDGSDNRVLASVPLSMSPLFEQYDPVDGELFVLESTDDLLFNLSVISPTNYSVLATIELGPDLANIAIDPWNGNLYTLYYACAVTCDTVLPEYVDSNVTIINGSTLKVQAIVTVGELPSAIAIGGPGGDVYVGNFESNNISVISQTTNRVVATVGVPLPSYLTYDPANADLYVSSQGSSNVSIVSTDSESVVGTLDVGNTPELPLSIYDPESRDVYAIGEWYARENSYGWGCAVISSTADTVLADAPVGFGPRAFAIDPISGDIFVVGDSPTVDVLGPWPVTFSTPRLPAGATWNVTLTNESGLETASSAGDPSMTFLVPNGTYQYLISPSLGYSVSPVSGSVDVHGQAVTVAVTFAWSWWIWAGLAVGLVTVLIGGVVALRIKGSKVTRSTALLREDLYHNRSDLAENPQETQGASTSRPRNPVERPGR